MSFPRGDTGFGLQFFTLDRDLTSKKDWTLQERYYGYVKSWLEGKDGVTVIVVVKEFMELCSILLRFNAL